MGVVDCSLKMHMRRTEEERASANKLLSSPPTNSPHETPLRAPLENHLPDPQFLAPRPREICFFVHLLRFLIDDIKMLIPKMWRERVREKRRQEGFCTVQYVPYRKTDAQGKK